MDDHLPYLGWSPTNPRMVTHQKVVYYRLRIWHIDLNCKIYFTTAIDSHPPSQGWSPTIEISDHKPWFGMPS